MRKFHRRLFPVPYRTGRIHRGRRALLAAGLVAALWWAGAERGLSSLSPELTEEAARHYIQISVQRAVDGALEQLAGPFVAVSYGEGGAVSSVTADAAALNQLKSQVLLSLAKRLEGKVTAKVSIGSLTGVGILNGRGPKVPVKLDLAGSADVSFDTSFRSAGLNQSCHRLTMTVTVQAHSQSKRFETDVKVAAATVLAETVVVGEVPKATLAGSAG